MRKQILLICLALSLASLGACVNRTSSGSAPLVHGLNQSGSASSEVSAANAAKVVKATPGVVAIYDGKSLNVSKGMLIPSRAFLRANAKGSASLALPNGATIKVSPNSEIALADIMPAAEAAGEKSGTSSFANKLSSVFAKNRESPASQATIGVRGLQ